MWAVMYFNSYILGMSLIIVTDHAALWALSTKVSLKSHILKWGNAFAEYTKIDRQQGSQQNPVIVPLEIVPGSNITSPGINRLQLGEKTTTADKFASGFAHHSEYR